MPAPCTQDNYATNNANLITISQYPNNATTVQLPGMAYRRGFHTTVVTPGGQIYVFGGQVRDPLGPNPSHNPVTKPLPQASTKIPGMLR